MQKNRNRYRRRILYLCRFVKNLLKLNLCIKVVGTIEKQMIMGGKR